MLFLICEKNLAKDSFKFTSLGCEGGDGVDEDDEARLYA